MMLGDLFKKKDVYVPFLVEPPADETKPPQGETKLPQDETKLPQGETKLPQGEAKLPQSMPAGEVTLAPCVADAGIAYHQELIPRFCYEHASLRKLLNTLKKRVTNHEFVDARAALQAFRSALTSHLLDEHIKLYAYLSPRLAEVPEHKQLLLALKSEKGRIDAAVTHLVSNYTDPGSISRNRQAFLVELEDVGAALLGHIEREEASLYALYTPLDGSSS